MSSRKAARPANHKVRKPRAVSSSAERNRQVIFPALPMQAIAVYVGQVCLGHILSRGKTGIEAFDFADRSLGVFSTQKLAADVVAAAAARKDMTK